MTELKLLQVIGEGQAEFCREQFAELDDIDRELRRFARLGYVEKVVRAVYPERLTGRRLMRVDVVGGLTPLGDNRRKELRGNHRQRAS